VARVVGKEDHADVNKSSRSSLLLQRQLIASIRRRATTKRRQVDWLIEQGLTSHQTHYRSYRAATTSGKTTQVSSILSVNNYLCALLYAKETFRCWEIGDNSSSYDVNSPAAAAAAAARTERQARAAENIQSLRRCTPRIGSQSPRWRCSPSSDCQS